MALVVGAVLRGVGLTRGDSDATVPALAASPATSPATGRAFHHFHPDEETLLRAAQRLGDPLDPPLTAYGTLPLYLARLATGTAAVLSGVPTELDTASGRRQAIVAGRLVAVALSLAALALTWHVGRRHFDGATGALAVALTVAAPLALQDAHFFTVDGLFALLWLLSLLAVIEALGAPSRRRYLWAGVVIGLTGAVRLNGLATGLVLLVGHLVGHLPERRSGGGRGAAVARGLRAPELWLAGAAAVVTLLVLEPYLVADPGRMTRADTTDDFAYSVQVARGEVLSPWSLADVDTVPFLHFWTHLWPQSVGWPLTLLLLAGIIHAAWRGGRVRWLLLGASVLYFVSVGGLHTKHVRYLLPLLAPLCLLAADAVLCLSQRRAPIRLAAIAAAAVALLWTGVYGIGFARIYTTEDARVTAARWLADNVPEGGHIAVERGGFTMAGLVDAERHTPVQLNTGSVFGTRGYLTCAAAARYLGERLSTADFVAIIDVNRARQFAGAAGLFPVAASFYAELLGGRLGFEPVARFKVYPGIGGWHFEDDEAESSFLGFDHPTVHILKRRADSLKRRAEGHADAEEPFTGALAGWQARCVELPGCADGELAAVVADLAAGDARTAGARVALLPATAPAGVVAMLQAQIHGRLGDPAAQQAAAARFVTGFEAPEVSGHLLPWAAASSLALLGEMGTTMGALRLGWRLREAIDPQVHPAMAQSYFYVGRQLWDAEQGSAAREAYLLGADIWPDAAALSEGGRLARDHGDREGAVLLWLATLEAGPPSAAAALRVADAVREAGGGQLLGESLRQLARQHPDWDLTWPRTPETPAPR